MDHVERVTARLVGIEEAERALLAHRQKAPVPRAGEEDEACIGLRRLGGEVAWREIPTGGISCQVRIRQLDKP